MNGFPGQVSDIVTCLDSQCPRNRVCERLVKLVQTWQLYCLFSEYAPAATQRECNNFTSCFMLTTRLLTVNVQCNMYIPFHMLSKVGNLTELKLLLNILLIRKVKLSYKYFYFNYNSFKGNIIVLDNSKVLIKPPVNIQFMFCNLFLSLT